MNHRSEDVDQAGDQAAWESQFSGNRPQVGTALLPAAAAFVPYTVVDGLAVTEGDIVIGRVEDLQTLDAAPEGSVTTHGGVRPRSIGITGDQFRWPGAVVPYEIDPALTDPGRVTQAMARWSELTRVTFVQRTPANAAQYPDYLYFTRIEGGVSYSAIGKQGGRQDVLVADGHPASIMIHELGHAIGLFHEQSREDRDQHVRILWDNIEPAQKYQFDQNNAGADDLGPYDFRSNMHYWPTAFAIAPGLTTIEPVVAGTVIAPSAEPTSGDVAGVEAMYPEKVGERFRYTATWQESAGPPTTWVAGWAAEHFAAKDEELAAAGWRLRSIDLVLLADGAARYSAVWVKSGGPQTTWVGGWAPEHFAAKDKELSAAGWRLRHLDLVLLPDGAPRYSAVWVKSGGPQTTWVGGWAPEHFGPKDKELAAAGWRLRSVDAVPLADGQHRYTAVWVKSGGAETTWVGGWATEHFVAKNNELLAAGWRLRTLDLVTLPDGSPRYTGCWQKAGGPATTWIGGWAPWHFMARERDMSPTKWRLTSISLIRY